MTVIGPHRNHPQPPCQTIHVIFFLDILAILCTLPYVQCSAGCLKKITNLLFRYSLAMSLQVSAEGLPMCEESWDSAAKTVYGTFTNITQVGGSKDDIS